MTDSAEGEAGRTEDNRSSSILDTSSSESSETWSNKGAGGTCGVLTSSIGTGIVLVSSLVSSESSMSIGTDSGEEALQASGGPTSIGGVGGGGDCGASADEG